MRTMSDDAFEAMVISRFESLEDLVNERTDGLSKTFTEGIKGAHARIKRTEDDAIETRTKVDAHDGRLTTLEIRGITEEAVKKAIKDVEETHDVVIQQKQARRTLTLSTWQTVTAVLTGAILLLGAVLGYFEIISHHLH